MGLAELYQKLTAEQRDFQFGRVGADPLTEGFPRKRVVHAGIDGTPVSPAEAQGIWHELMSRPPTGEPTQTAYIHIPFCKTKCLYCAFFQNGTDQLVEDAYVDRLVQDMERESASPRLKDGHIHSVFIGGGTPTSLSPANAERLLATIRTCLPLANDYELTLEGRIHDLIPEKMDVWMAGGVNRMSLGVQSFDTKVRRQVGRLDDKETVLKNLKALEAYNQCVTVIDLIYGLPGQDHEIWKEDLDCLIASGVDGADLYQLNVFDNSDLSKRIAAGALPPAATTKEQAKMFAFARDYLNKRRFRRLSAAHWSQTNRERSLYNTLAKRDVTMFPFGSGAGGHLDGYSTMLYRTIDTYSQAVERHEKPFMALVKQSEVQPLVNCTLEQLEQGYFNVDALVAADGRLTDLKWLYALWQDQGFVSFNGVLYELTEAGEFWQVNLAQTTVECINYLIKGEETMSLQGVAAQDGDETKAMSEKVLKIITAMKKAKSAGGGPTPEAMAMMTEAMKMLTPEELQEVMKNMGK